MTRQTMTRKRRIRRGDEWVQTHSETVTLFEDGGRKSTAPGDRPTCECWERRTPTGRRERVTCSRHSLDSVATVNREVAGWYALAMTPSVGHEDAVQRGGSEEVTYVTLEDGHPLLESVSVGVGSVVSVEYNADGSVTVGYTGAVATWSAGSVLALSSVVEQENHARKTTWSRWDWRDDWYKYTSARNVCRECGAAWGVRRETPHVCGETLDSLGRVRVDPEQRAIKHRGTAALARARFALRRGKAVSESDAAAIVAAGLEVPTCS